MRLHQVAAYSGATSNALRFLRSSAVKNAFS
jgi:hypothetical protein